MLHCRVDWGWRPVGRLVAERVDDPFGHRTTGSGGGSCPVLLLSASCPCLQLTTGGLPGHCTSDSPTDASMRKHDFLVGLCGAQRRHSETVVACLLLVWHASRMHWVGVGGRKCATSHVDCRSRREPHPGSAQIGPGSAENAPAWLQAGGGALLKEN